MGNVVRVCLLLGLFAAPAMLFAIPFEEVEITVRDGAKLAADVYPAVRGDVKKPTILVQTPYNRRFYRAILSLQRYNRVTALPLDTTSFHYVIVDWRGFFDSRDAAEAGYDRGLDGVDIIDWIRQQEWSDGQVGLWGASALGGVQHATAKHQPEGLVCIVPMVTDIKSSYEKYYYGGALREAQVDALQALDPDAPATDDDLIEGNDGNDVIYGDDADGAPGAAGRESFDWQDLNNDDVDGTVVWYDITKVGGASTHQETTAADLEKLIREAGYTPIERDTLYRKVLRDGAKWRVDEAMQTV